ncbi:pupal cuticle protein Edg-78E-like [Lucilia sericata]|uniref:pupal cuticle protein Edg-78E-like n=1 Tax=Lucilia sericata TaxID=13632 RepID=UPI0018A88219|nr:pupal cuticle protein Edg-78E-like [Lucilia sericata]
MLKYLLLITFIACVAAVDDDAHAHVNKEFKKEDGHGHFSYGYDITNGIGADEAGDQSAVHGEFHFTTKEGVPVKVSYTADANGYHPQGDVIPTAPPTPAAILKALDYINSHPKAEKNEEHKKHH